MSNQTLFPQGPPLLKAPSCFLECLLASPGGSAVKKPPTMQETACNAGDEVQTLGWEDLEKEMPRRRQCSAWEIPWSEELGGLPSHWPQELASTWRLNRYHHHRVFCAPCASHSFFFHGSAYVTTFLHEGRSHVCIPSAHHGDLLGQMCFHKYCCIEILV